MEKNKTPTPLQVTVTENGKVAIKCPRGLVATMEAGYTETRKTDAAYIVRAVNAHENLLDTLKQIAVWAESNQVNVAALELLVKQAIGKAERGSK